MAVLWLAREDLSQRLGVNVNDIKLAEIARVEWGDTSLGNPQPGMFYAQVIVPGFKMLLEADGLTSEYHTDLGERVEYVG